MFRIPSRQLSRADLTRRAFDRAYLRLRKDTDAGVISPGEAKAKFLALRDAYYQRKAARSATLRLSACSARTGCEA